ncbi:uncharacterized protein B0H64DRAFT_441994 [Chaetomium fimeti]|uniref:Apple domain-containing protein n=1 Tax=Chaetomium fimeti TaxID=1854472 RepID=A0AAE0HG86_9PEZI|nr:hypothetical protein B0H64DRAFT_441994 [Chaetomium fimeti]
MDSPIHPDLQPGPRNRAIPVPFPIRNDPLIQGHDIELAPRPYEETVHNPTPEVLPPSDLELAHTHAKPPQPHPYAIAVPPEHTILPKAWESKSQTHSSRPGSVHSQSVVGSHVHVPGHAHAYSVGTVVPVSAGSAVPLQGGRYSYTDFSNYNSNLGDTEDLYHTPTDSLNECIDLCATQEGCVGAGWGEGNANDGRATCWLKSQLGEPNGAPLWSFVIEDTGKLKI